MAISIGNNQTKASIGEDEVKTLDVDFDDVIQRTYNIDEDFSYDGEVKQIPIKGKGKLALKVWGGMGNGGRNPGYAEGVLNAKEEDEKLFVRVGGNGSGLNGGWNGGGNGIRNSSSAGGGGGATDIRIKTDSVYARVIVAGGSGGKGPQSSGGSGGGPHGGRGYDDADSVDGGSRDAGGGSQTQGGKARNTGGNQGTFGAGGSASGYASGGGGGGWYGGGGAYDNDSDSDGKGGGGGSGYIHTAATAVNYPAGCLLDESNYLEDAVNTKGGNTTSAGRATIQGTLRRGAEEPTYVTEPGIYHNPTLGLISISADGQNRITISDKNAGAWSNDIEDELSYGGYFQFGNSHGFGVLPEPEPTPGQRLPNEYQEVEYIESTGTQYIDTGYNTTNDIKIEAEVMFNRKYDSNVLFGTTLNSWSYGDCLCYLSTQGGFQAGAYNTDVRWTNGDANIKYEVIYTLSSVTLNLDTKTYSVSAKGNRLTIMYGNTLYSELKLYSFKIYTGTTLIRDFVPCYRKIDGVIGLYDLVNNQFYTNSGTGTFAKGPNVYYDRHWQPGANTILYMPLNGDLQDYSGSNNHGTWSGTSEYRDVDGKKYAYFNENSCIDLTSYPIGTGNPAAFTNSCVVKLNSSGQATMHHFGQDANNSRSKLITFYSDGRVLQDRYGAGYDIYIGNAIPSSLYGTRVHIVYVYDGNGGHTIYLNGELYGTGSGALNVVGGYNKKVGSPSPSASAGYGLAEFIIENGMWTAEDVADYFNRVKSLYGIS